MGALGTLTHLMVILSTFSNVMTWDEEEGGEEGGKKEKTGVDRVGEKKVSSFGGGVKDGLLIILSILSQAIPFISTYSSSFYTCSLVRYTPLSTSEKCR